MDIGHHVEGAGMGAGGGMRRGAGSGYRLSAGGNANARASMLLDTWPKPLCAEDPLPQARPPALMIVSMSPLPDDLGLADVITKAVTVSGPPLPVYAHIERHTGKRLS